MIGSRLARRWRQLSWLARSGGASGIAYRLRLRVADMLRPGREPWPMFAEDVLAADLAHPFVPNVPPIKEGEPIWLNWVMTGPGPGSGGHTTLFRAIRHLEAQGYRHRIYIYHPLLTDPQHYAAIMREHYGFTGPVDRLDGAMPDAHGVIATSWGTAYAVFNARCTGKRFYFVQDFEPDFFSVGAERVLAEATYSMGLHGLTAGRWLASRLSADYGMQADAFEFGSDTSRYTNRGQKRTGIAYYARPSTPRRGFELGLLALQLFARRRPDIDIHLYGEHVGPLPIRFVDHGLVGPDQLNDIYNQCYAGLSLSLTNVSLVPFEMLAAGCIPVTNDAPHNRMVLDNPYVHYAPATPQALAAELEAIVSDPDHAATGRLAARSQQSLRWEDAGKTIDAAIRRAVQAAASAPERSDQEEQLS